MERTDEAKAGSAVNVEVYAVMARAEPPGIGAVDPWRNFSLRKERDATVEECLANPRLSLYALDPETRTLAFVATPDPSLLLREPFFYRAQFDQAREVWFLPYDAAFRAAESLPPVCCSTILIYSVGRCGSTLLSNIFQNVEGAVSVSEPDVFTQISDLRREGHLEAAEAQALARASWKLLFTSRTDLSWLVVKLRARVATLQAELSAGIPEAFPVFMYRGAEAVIESYDRIWGSPHARSRWLYRTPVLGSLYRAWRTRTHAADRRFDAFRPLVSKRSPAEIVAVQGLAGYFMLDWLLKVDAYLSLRRVRGDSVAVRYEDLVRDPEAVVAELFRACGIPESHAKVATSALGRDSQAGTEIARARVRKRGLDARDREIIRSFFAEETSLASPDAILPGTLTHPE